MFDPQWAEESQSRSPIPDGDANFQIPQFEEITFVNQVDLNRKGDKLLGVDNSKIRNQIKT